MQILGAALVVARRDGLAAVTARSVAKEAGLSQGLVFFHFGSTELLLAELVTYVTRETLTTGPQPADYAALDGSQQLPAFVGGKFEYLAKACELRVIDILVEAWVAGLSAPATRKSVVLAAERHREAFLPVARAAIAAEPERYTGVTAESLAATVLSLILGTSMQAAIDPSFIDGPALAAAVRALLSSPRAAVPRAPPVAPKTLPPSRKR